MKASFVLVFFFVMTSLAQATESITCRVDSYYSVTIGEKVVVSYNGLPSHPEMAEDLIVDQDKIVRANCGELCIEIPFQFDEKSEVLVLKLNSTVYPRSVVGTLTDSKGNTEEVSGYCY